MNKQTMKVSTVLIYHTTQCHNYYDYDRNLQSHEYLKSYTNISTQYILDMHKKWNKILTKFHSILNLATSDKFPGPYFFPTRS
jgi:hypothetical protein